ncbi:hypothetical protein ACFQ77_39810 [Streptomyces virginiae]|uniref:hypothetical protein n=1 Tax=Streptomyces virginiae TaxID=1961 RepID=UPI00369AA999
MTGDAVAIPAHLGDRVLHTLDVLFPQLRPVVLEELTRARTYFLAEPGQGGAWGEDVWTLDAGTWHTPHLPSRPCGDLTVWRCRSDEGGCVLPAADLRRALRLAYPIFRSPAAGASAQQSNPGGIL